MANRKKLKREIIALLDRLIETERVEAHAKGRALGRTEGWDQARQEMQSRLAKVVGLDESAGNGTSPKGTRKRTRLSPTKPKRAKPGFVQSNVRQILRQRPDGLRPAEIIDAAAKHFNATLGESGVRMALSRLAELNEVIKRGDKWFFLDAAKRPEGEPLFKDE